LLDAIGLDECLGQLGWAIERDLMLSAASGDADRVLGQCGHIGRSRRELNAVGLHALVVEQVVQQE